MLLVLAIVLVVWGVAKVGHARLRSHGIHILAWRWFSGAAWHGHPVTDAGWMRAGQRALTPTGHATRFWHLPRWKRAAWRTGGTALGLAAGLGLLMSWLATVLAVAALPLAWLVGRLAWRQRQVLMPPAQALALVPARALAATPAGRMIEARATRRRWLHPLHLAAHELAEIPRATRAASWITAEIDKDGAVAGAVLELPPGWPADSKNEGRLVAIAAAKLGIEAPQATWRRAGPKPQLRLTHSPKAPPPRVSLADVREAIEAARADELVLGAGKGESLVETSLDSDSPHLAMSMGSGAGKSVLGRCIGSQVLYRGGLLAVLDYKMTSHAWARGLPNVAYADTIPKIHRLLLWLEAEMERRNEVAAAAVDVEGEIHANVGPRILVVSEEINATMTKLRRYWAQVRGSGEPARSPAVDAHDALLFMGRQTLMNLLAIAQMLSAKASGSGEARENMGTRMLGRYSANAWKMLVPQHPMPPKSTHPGRIQVVSTSVREAQVAFMTGSEARALALAGRVGVPPRRMPCIAGVPEAAEIENPGPDLPFVPETPPSVLAPGGRVTLSEAVALGVVSRSLPALRKASQRDPDFPARRGMRGLAAEHDAAELAAWDAGRS